MAQLPWSWETARFSADLGVDGASFWEMLDHVLAINVKQLVSGSGNWTRTYLIISGLHANVFLYQQEIASGDQP